MKPKFPGFSACIQMMHCRDPQEQEDGYHWLLHRADKLVDDLIVEFGKEENRGIQWELLEIMGHSHSDKVLPLLAEHLRSNDPLLRTWAIFGLKELGTKQAAQILRDARYYQLSSLSDTEHLHKQIEHIVGPEQPWERFTRKF